MHVSLTHHNLHLYQPVLCTQAPIAPPVEEVEVVPTAQKLREAARVERVKRKTTISAGGKVEGVETQRLREIEKAQEAKSSEYGSVGSRLKAMRGLMKKQTGINNENYRR